MICSWSAVHENKGVSMTDNLGEEGDVSDRNCRHESTPMHYLLYCAKITKIQNIPNKNPISNTENRALRFIHLLFLLIKG